MATLAGVLASLRKEDGSPDINARRQQLDSLISQLLSSELRHVKEHICALPWTMDFIPKLPTEILTCISDYMTPADFLVTQMVSKSWRECFTTPNLIDHAVREHFIMAYMTSFKTTTAPSDRLILFNSLSRRTNAIYQGNYRSMACFSYGGSSINPFSVRCVSKHRVVWTSNEMIFVRNLLSGEVKRFVTPERDKVKGLCLREDCLLVVCTSSSALHAWSIETGEMHEIRLPAIPLLFDNNHGNALVSLKGGSVLKWTIGQHIKPLNIPVQPEGAELFFLAFDPLYKDIFTRCHMQLLTTPASETSRSASSQKILRLVADKFNDDCILSSSAIDIPLDESGWRWFNRNGTYHLRCAMAKKSTGFDENGRYSVLLPPYYLMPGGNCPCSEIPYDLRPSCARCNNSFLRVCYTAVDGRWQTDTYAMSGNTTAVTASVDTSQMHFTGNLALLPVIPDRNMCCVNDLLVVGVGPVAKDEVSQDPSTTRLRCICGPDGDSVVHRVLDAGPNWTKEFKEGSVYKVGFRYAWPREAIPDAIILRENAQTSFLKDSFQVCGNSTFTVLFGHEGYVVWCYDKDIALSQPSDETRRLLRSWPLVSDPDPTQ